MKTDGRIFKFRPQHTRGIEQFDVLVQLNPLQGTGNARPVCGLGDLLACEPVDHRGLTNIGHTDHHRADGTRPDSPADHPFDFFLHDFLAGLRQLRHKRVVKQIGGDDQRRIVLQLLDPLLGDFRFAFILF